MAAHHPIRRPRHWPFQRGLSLLDLVSGVAVAAVLCFLALPSHQGLLSRYRTLSQAQELTQLLLFARGEAIRRGARVTVCRSASHGAANPSCDGGSWSDGWIAFLDKVDTASNRPGVLDGNDLLLRVSEGHPNVRVEATATFRQWLAFTPTGRSIGNMGLSNGTFCLVDGPFRRDVVVAVTGRVTVSAPLAFPEDATC